MNTKNRKILFWVILCLAAVLLLIVITTVVIIGRTVSMVKSEDPYVWLPEIEAFEEKDIQEPPPRDTIVFTGSSSIRLWVNLEEDMAPLPVINRGFGGAKIEDVVYFIDRVVLPYNPAAVVLFAGTNNLAGYNNDSTPEEILASFVHFVKAVHEELPGIPIYYISITPTRLRWSQWPLVQQTNTLIETYTRENPDLHFIDTTGQFLNEEGKPKRNQFTYDMLHLNRKGYETWASEIKPVLEKDLYHLIVNK